MKDKTVKKDWAIKKGMQMVQGSNDEASKASQESLTHKMEQNNQNNKKSVHWSGVQMQRFQACAHAQHCQDESVKKSEMEQNTCSIKKVDLTQPEEACKLKHISTHDTSRIALLDTGSTFNLTNNKEMLMNSVKAVQPMTSRTNVRQQQMTTHGKIPDLTEEM